MSDLFGPDPEPYEGDYWDGHDEATAEPEGDGWEPTTCWRCDSVVDDWDQWCHECGASLTIWAELSDKDRAKDYNPTPEEIEKAGF